MRKTLTTVTTLLGMASGVYAAGIPQADVIYVNDIGEEVTLEAKDLVLTDYSDTERGPGSSNHAINTGNAKIDLPDGLSTYYALTLSIDSLASETDSPIISAGGGNSASGMGVHIKDSTLMFCSDNTAADAYGSLTVTEGDVLTYIRVADATDSTKDVLYVINQTSSLKDIQAGTAAGANYITRQIERTDTTLTDGVSKLWTNGGNAKMTLVGIADLDGVTSDSFRAVGGVFIPEPATATLSLLALAGLAARRRRK